MDDPTTPRRIGEEAVRFLVMGGVNTFLTWLLYLALDRVVSYAVAYSLSYVAGVVLAYYLNARFVFDAKMSFRSFLKFPIVYVVQYLAGLALMYVLVDVVAFAESLAPLAVTVLTIPLTFVMSRLVLSPTAAADDPGPR